MAIRQTPINSGFGAKTQASEVMAGRDLSGKTAIVTGGYSGLGLETTKALADAGARVIVTARRPDVAREALLGLDEVRCRRSTWPSWPACVGSPRPSPPRAVVPISSSTTPV